MIKIQPKQGFSLIELLLVVALMAIIAAVVLIIINPIETTKRARDGTRLSDLDSLQKAITLVREEAVTQATTIMCHNMIPPCSGNSNDPGPNVRKNDGSGWIKINFAAVTAITVPTLPVDPVNDATYHYSYMSDGSDYEIDTTLESQTYSSKMSQDGGSNNSKYEAGSKLDLIP